TQLGTPDEPRHGPPPANWPFKSAKLASRVACMSPLSNRRIFVPQAARLRETVMWFLARRTTAPCTHLVHKPASNPARGHMTVSLMVRRLTQLLIGLLAYGVSTGLMLEGGLGSQPWDVLHQGLSKVTGISVGVVGMIAGALVLLCWIPLRQRPGIGTI